MQKIQNMPKPFPLFKILLSIPFLLALLVSSIGIYYSIKAEPISTSKANATAIVQLKTIATAYIRKVNTQVHATATTQAHLAATTWTQATAAAQTSENAAAAAALANPYNIPAKTVGLDEALLNNTNTNWDVGPDSTNVVDSEFKKGGLDLLSRQTNTLAFSTDESTHFTNFIYQVQMKMINGDEEGLIFRTNRQQKTYYYFNLNVSDGSYNWGTETTILFTDTSPAIKTGYNKTNLLTIIARINSFTFYINQQKVYSTNDSTYTSGQIGLDVVDHNNTTEAVFNNSKIWTF